MTNLSRPFYGSYGTFGRYAMTNCSMEIRYHWWIPFSQLPLKPSAGEKKTYLRTKRKKRSYIPRRLAQFSMWTPNAQLVKSIHHGSIMARIKWESLDLDDKDVERTYQPSMPRWKDSFGRSLAYESSIVPRFTSKQIVPTWWT